MGTRLVLFLGLWLSHFGHPLHAQSAPDQEAIEKTILTLFDGMRQADSTLILSVMHPEMSLQTVVVNPQGEVVLRSTPMEAFIQAAGGTREDVWDEQISGLVVLQDGPLSTVWMDYEFYRNDEFSHCGVNTMNLVRQEEGWKIISIVDTRRRDGCDTASVEK